MDLGLTDKVALVVAASTGLGKAIATELAREGAHVMIASRDEEKLQAAVEEMNYLSLSRIEYFPCDLTKTDDIQKLVEHTRDTLGPIDILVNNAGGPPTGIFSDFTDADWQSAFELTLMSYVRLTRAVLPDMKNRGGRILNNASASVKEALDSLILSNVFRSGINGLSKSLAQELASDNILVNTIGAGRIATDRIQQMDERAAQKQGKAIENIQQEKEASIPLGRYGTPEEFAKTAVFLVSSANTYVTGQTIIVDGGLMKSY